MEIPIQLIAQALADTQAIAASLRNEIAARDRRIAELDARLADRDAPPPASEQ